MRRAFHGFVGLVAACSLGFALLAWPDEVDASSVPPSAVASPELVRVEHGAYVARASGCMSCHGEDLSGGYQVETPMGTIVASNISPSRNYGIGGYSRDDLADVLRRGVSPDRRLYPAMPYASYRGMADADIDALFAWLQDQPPSRRRPGIRPTCRFPSISAPE